MILLGGVFLTLAITALGLAMMQVAVIEARLVQQHALDTQTFYTAETGLALLTLEATRHFEEWESLVHNGGTVSGPAGCFPISPCLHAPGYLTWATEAGDHALRLHALARAPAPVSRTACPRGGYGSLIVATLHETGEGTTHTYTRTDWGHLPCPFSAP